MSRFNKLLSNFKYGELSPKFYGRKDLEEYSQGAELFDNFIPLVEGGFTKRMGSEYVADVTAAAVGTLGPALIPFVISKTEAYIVVINKTTDTSLGITMYKNDGTAITGGALLSSYVTSTNALDPKGFVYAQVGDVLVLTHTSGTYRPQAIVKTSPDADTFEVIDLILYESSTIGGLIPAITNAVRMPYRDANITATTITPSVTTGTGTLTASTAIFDADMPGTYFKITQGATTGIALITSFTSTTVVNMTVVLTFGATTASTNWEEGAWSNHRGWPRTIVAHEQRFIWGGNAAQPDTIWCSRLGSPFFMMQARLAQDIASGADTSGINYYIDTAIPDAQAVYSNVGIQILESDPFSFTLSAKEVNPITWMQSKRSLIVGTLGAEYIISGDGGFSILTVRAPQQTNHGGSPVKSIGQGNEALFISRDGHKLRTFKYNDENGSFLSTNISLTADHIRKIDDAIYSAYEDNYEFLDTSHRQSEEHIYMITSTNRLVGLVYSKENGNISWFRHTFPTSDNVWGVCSAPNVSGGADDLWVVIEREIDGAAAFYLERIGIKFNAASLEETNTAVEENLPRFLDSHVKIDNSTPSITDTISGLDHLEGETVAFVYRGERLSDYTVASGDITLNAADQLKVDTAGFGFVGIVYTANFQTLDVEAGGDLGFSEGHTQRIERADLRFYETRYAKVGSPDVQDPVKFTFATVRSLYSGMSEMRLPLSPDKDQKIKIVSDQPQPCTVLAIALRGSTDD